MTPVNKVVLVSKSGYDPKHDHLLSRLVDERIELFCVVGKDAEIWEEIMDELYVGDGSARDFDLLTSSHPGESVQSVLDFAKSFVTSRPGELRVIEV